MSDRTRVNRRLEMATAHETNHRPERLGQYIKRMGISMAEFGSQLGVTRETVRAWCAMEYLPSLRRVSEIERLTSGAVTARSFYEDDVLDSLQALNNARRGA